MARVSGEQDQEGQLANFGRVVRQRRLDLGLTQEAFADAAGIDRSHMSKVEGGKRNVTFLNILRIAHALNARPSEILGDAGL